MAHRSVRGFMLRAYTSLTVLSLVVSGTVATAATATAATPHTHPTRTNAYSPTTVNRTPTGGAAPTSNWQQTPSSKTSNASGPGVHTLVTSTCSQAGSGLMSDEPLQQIPVTDRLTFYVNRATGNFVMDAEDLSLKGTGENLSIDNVFNNLTTASGSFGLGWQLNAGADVGLTFSGSSVILHGDSGYCATFTQNSDGSYAEAPALHATLVKNTGGSYSLHFDSSGEVWSFTAAGWLSSEADRNGNATTYNYNSDGTTASITDSQGRVTTFAYDGNGHIASITDPSGGEVSHYSYNSAGELTSYTDPSNRTITIGWDSAMDPTYVTNPNGGRYTFVFDTSSRLTSISVPNPQGALTTTYSYGSGQTTETDPNGHASTYYFDSQNRQTKATDANGNSESQSWSANSDVNSTTDGLSNKTTDNYDSLNNYTGSSLPTGAATTVGYGNASFPHLPTSSADPAGDQVTYKYDTAGNLTTVHSTGLNADLDKRTYNSPKGTLASDTDGNGHTTTYGYDSAGNLTDITPPSPRGAVHYTYDLLSRITQANMGNGTVLDYDYDVLNRPLDIYNDATGQTLWSQSYDDNGNTDYTQTPAANTQYTFNSFPVGDLAVSAVTNHSDNTTTTLTYGYDKVGNLTSLTEPDGTTSYGYDRGNRLTSLADPWGQTTTFGYDAANHRTSVTWPNAGSEAIGYDNSGRQTSLTVNNTAGAQLLHTAQSYTTTAGKDSDLVQSATNVAGATTAYTYDSLQRLTAAGSASFSYDTASNMTNQNGVAYTVNAADEMTQQANTTVGYDGSGNPTSSQNPSATLSYSPTNQLLSQTSGSQQLLSASYDTSDQTQPRTISENNGGTTTTHQFLATALGVNEVVDNSSAALDVTRDPKGTLVTENQNGTRYDVVTDYQGSVIGLVSGTGAVAATYTYSPYGATTATGTAAAGNPFRYDGTYQLQDGLDLMGYRDYNSAWGRFTQPDPTGKEYNPYGYTQDNPVNKSDVTGAISSDSLIEYTKSCLEGAIVGATIGGLATLPAGGEGALPGIPGGCIMGVIEHNAEERYGFSLARAAGPEFEALLEFGLASL
jgi:RHS repeat-associated protein